MDADWLKIGNFNAFHTDNLNLERSTMLGRVCVTGSRSDGQLVEVVAAELLTFTHILRNNHARGELFLAGNEMAGTARIFGRLLMHESGR